MLDRDEYRIAVLYDPAKPWAPWAPQAGLQPQAGRSSTARAATPSYEQAEAPDVLNETALGRGFATMSHALDNAGHNCNIATQAESLIMTKERVVEQYGELRYTIGSGCSGGSLVQQQVANAYPGLYQGITPACSFTGRLVVGHAVRQLPAAAPLLREPDAAGRRASCGRRDAISAVEGHPNPANAVTFTEVIPSQRRAEPRLPGRAAASRSTTRTRTPRACAARSRTTWSTSSAARAAGRLRRPAARQHRLRVRPQGARARARSRPAQFVDVNAKVGSFDIDYDPIARAHATPTGRRSSASTAAARSTRPRTSTRSRSSTCAGPDPGAFHDVYRTYVMRARLEREHGTAANQILWRGQVPLLGDANFVDESIVAMDEWLAAVEKDRRDVPLARKILEDKPEVADATAAPTARATSSRAAVVRRDGAVATPTRRSRPACRSPTTRCAARSSRCGARTTGRSSSPTRSGRSCSKLFPNGVCDFTKPGEDRVARHDWQTYQDDDGNVDLRRPPARARRRCSAPFDALGLRGSRRCVEPAQLPPADARR